MNTKSKRNKPFSIQHMEIEASPVMLPLSHFGSFGVRGFVVFSNRRAKYFAMHLEPDAWEKAPMKFITDAIQQILRGEKRHEHKAKRK
jgi:hypothetical protein